MRCLLMILLMLSLAGTAMASVTGNTSATGKDPGVPYVNPPGGVRITGDTVADPFILPAFPYTVTGTTIGFNHDYDEVCPYTGSTSPDVVYSYTAVGDNVLTVDLCYSQYDTKVYVYQDAVTPGAPLACNDDYYFAAPCWTYSSRLELVPVTAGHVYYIVVDGYGGASGTYQLEIDGCCPPPPTGACCAEDGLCTITVPWECAGAWQGDDTVCVPNPCEPVPAVPTTWGQIKATYK